MPFLALRFPLDDVDTQHAEAACLELGALAVTYSDARDDAVLEPAPGEVRLWPATQLTALFAGDADVTGLSAQIAGRLRLAPGAIAAEPVADRAWEREWLRDFHAMRFGTRLWVCPHHESVGDAGAVVLKLDPGLAFGTGTHPSTALCLEWLDAQLAPGARVIDYGCGSGILAIAAALLGAAQVEACDIDPQALAATRENAAANGVAARIRVHDDEQDLGPGSDVLVANIIAGTLIALAPRLAALLQPGGSLLLAGILDEQAEVVAAVFTPWFDMRRAGERAGWVALAGRRR
jgi:ribosomal protein L11 methyltransferase